MPLRHEGAKSLVRFRGVPAPALMVIGEPPDADEDETSLAFAGKPGEMLDKALSAAGHEVVVIAPGREAREEARPEGGRIRWVPAPVFPLDRNYRYFSRAEPVHALLDAEQPDVIEASSPWRAASIAATWRGPATRALVMHADPMAAHAYRILGPIADRELIDRGCEPYWRHLRRMDDAFDVVVSAGRSLTARLRAGGLGKVATVPMGVDPGLFSPDLRDEALRGRLLALCDLDSRATLFLGVGRLGAEKRWEMVAAAATVAAAREPVGLVIVGDGKARRQIERAIGANPHIRLLGPIGDRPFLARVMASCDALIHGCEAETFCFAAAEAKASGLPIIVPDEGGAADHADDGESRRYRAGDPADAARAMLDFVRGARVGPAIRAPRIRTMDDHFRDLVDLYASVRKLALAA